MVDPYLLERAIEAYGTWQNAAAAGATHLKEFEDALRTLVAAGATADEVARIIPDGASWLHHVAGTTDRTLNCSFCLRPQRQVQRLIAGPGVYICDDCVGRQARAMATRGAPVQRCSFCGQKRASLGVGGATQICEDCLDLCNRILREEAGAPC